MYLCIESVLAFVFAHIVVALGQLLNVGKMELVVAIEHLFHLIDF